MSEPAQALILHSMACDARSLCGGSPDACTRATPPHCLFVLHNLAFLELTVVMFVAL